MSRAGSRTRMGYHLLRGDRMVRSCRRSGKALDGPCRRRGSGAKGGIRRRTRPLQFYDRYAGLIYGTGMRYLGDRETAEELVQDVFTSVWKNAAGFDPARASFATWVYRITRNRATDLIRRRGAHQDRRGRTALRTGETDPSGDLPQLRRGRRASRLSGPQGGARPRLLPRLLAAGDLRPYGYASGYGKEPHDGGAARLARDHGLRRRSVVCR